MKSSLFRSFFAVTSTIAAGLFSNINSAAQTNTPQSVNLAQFGLSQPRPKFLALSFKTYIGSVLGKLASGQLRHKATVMFTNLTTALRGSNETGLAMT